MDSIFAAISNLYRWLNSPETVAAFFNNRFYTILAVVLLMRAKYAAYGSLWLTALVNIPGTILHELLHYMIGVITNAHPCNFTIFPKKISSCVFAGYSIKERNGYAIANRLEYMI